MENNTNVSVSTEDNQECTKKKLRNSKPMVVFAVQSVVLICIIAVSLVNLSLEKPDKSLWISLLFAALGIIVPAPNYKAAVNSYNNRQPQLTPQWGLDQLDGPRRKKAESL